MSAGWTETQCKVHDRIMERKFPKVSDNTENKFIKLNQEIQVKQIPLDLIEDNPYQTRKFIDMKKIKNLAESISEIGLINPITLIKDQDKYIIVNGHRRYYAFKQLKIFEIPAIIKKRDKDKTLILDMVHENLIREDLTPREKAESIRLLLSQIKSTEGDIEKICTLINLLKNFKRRGYIPEHRRERTKIFSDEDVHEVRKILKILGTSENATISHLIILTLPEFIQDKVVFTKGSLGIKGKVSISLAYQLARVQDKEYQQYLFEKIVNNHSSLKIIQALVDQHIKKVERGEWRNLISMKQINNKVKDDTTLINRVIENSNRLAANYNSVKVSNLLKLEETLEQQEFIGVANSLKKEIELLLGVINSKLADRGFREVKKNTDPFEIEVHSNKLKKSSRFTFPIKQFRLMNIDPDKNHILSVKVTGVKTL